MQNQRDSEIKVFITNREAKCDECGEELGRSAWITLQGERGVACLTCADLDHLVFLPSGDAALTRRSRKHAGLSAIVLRWSRARKRYERKGILVESEALERAEHECEADAKQREVRRAQALLRREELDEEYVKRFALRIREQYPQCPPGREAVIAEHACRKYSGRVGRSAAAKDFDETSVRLAVVAHIRHTETEYDALLCDMIDRAEARSIVHPAVSRILHEWESGRA